MIKKILLILSFVGLISIMPAPVFAARHFEACEGSSAAVCQTNSADLTSLVKTVVEILSWFVGVASVISIIIAGFYLVSSAGNPDNVKKAKNAILYAVIGIIVAISASLIVNFVINNI